MEKTTRHFCVYVSQFSNRFDPFVCILLFIHTNARTLKYDRYEYLFSDSHDLPKIISRQQEVIGLSVKTPLFYSKFLLITYTPHEKKHDTSDSFWIFLGNFHWNVADFCDAKLSTAPGNCFCCLFSLEIIHFFLNDGYIS